MSKIAILHAGLHLTHPSIPPEHRAEVGRRLQTLTEEMRAAGYDYEVFHASPETGLDEFRAKLASKPYDGVMIGGGVIGNVEMAWFMEQMIEAIQSNTPQAKIMLYDHAVGGRGTIERRFPGNRSVK